jgi:zinc transporter, ZIP family
LHRLGSLIGTSLVAGALVAGWLVLPGRLSGAGRGDRRWPFVDGIPESIALGLTVAEGELGVALLVGIVVGNIVEAYGAAQPIVASGRSKRFALLLLSAIGVAVALATVAGATVLSEASSASIGVAQAVASGAVLSQSSRSRSSPTPSRR